MALIAAWSAVHFDGLPCRYGKDGSLHAIVVANHGGLRLQLIATLPDPYLGLGSGLDRDAADYTATLRARAGEIDRSIASQLPAQSAVEVTWQGVPLTTDPNAFRTATSGAGAAQFSAMWALTWPASPLADTQIGVRVDDAHYVLALPYGLCRDERRPVPEAIPAAGASPATHPWTKVTYESVVDEPYRISAEVTTPGELSVVLYREDRGHGPPPLITVLIDGLAARQLADWSRTDSYRLVAPFEVIARDARRTYAKVAIGRFIAQLPSSLLRAP